MHIEEQVDKAYEALPAEALPEEEWQIYVRSDSATYEQDPLDHWHQRKWRFGVSADMIPQPRAAIEALPEEAWQSWAQEGHGQVWEWAEVPYVPSWKQESKGALVYRYLAIRIRQQQGALFDGGDTVRHFAVVTNWWDMDDRALLEWYREKQVTVEHVHHVVKNELGGGTYPSRKHGANAAWLRLQVITHNLLELLKAVALPPEYAKARPKRLRFAVFTHVGQVVHHAYRMVLRVATQIWKGLFCSGQARLYIAWGTT